MATKIKTLATTQMTLAAHAQFHLSVNEAIIVGGAEKLHLAALAAPYAAAARAEADVVNRPTAYSETPEMQAKDHERDQALSLLFNLTDAFAKSPAPADLAPARRITALLAPYRSIQTHEYQRETTEIDGLIVALSEAAADDLKALALSAPLSMLEDLNAEFRSLTNTRVAEIATRAPLTEANTRELRANSDDLYHQVVDTVNAFAIAAPAPEIADFINTINALVSQYKLIIANQGKKKTEPENPTA